MGTRTRSIYFVISKYLDYRQNYMMLLEQSGHIVVLEWLLLHDWTRTKFLYAGSRDWTTLLPLRKLFLPSLFNSVDFWSSLSLIVLDIELTEKNKIKELGLFIEGSLQGFSFGPPKTFKPNKETTWNTSRLHGIAWSSGKLDYEKLLAVFYDIKVMNAEVFAKGLEKYRLLKTLLRQKGRKFGWLWLPESSRYCQNGQFVNLL